MRADVVDLLIALGADTNARSDSACTALHYACRLPGPDLVRKLLLHGAAASVNWRNDNGCTPLTEACACGNVDVLRLLLNIKHTMVNPTSRFKTSAHGELETRPFILAALRDHAPVLDLLIRTRRRSVQHQLPEALLGAARRGNEAAVETMLQYTPADFTGGGTASDRRLTALCVASGCGHLQIVHLLISRGADPNAAAEMRQGNRLLWRESPLHAAATVPAPELAALIVQELIQAGGHDDGEAYAFLHTDGSFRRETALVGAARLGRLPVVRALLKAAPGNASSSSAAALDAAFRIAVAGGHRGVARELLDANRSLLYESAKSWAWQVQGAEDMLGGFRVEDKARLVLIAAHKHKHLQGIPAHLIQRIVAQIFMKRE